MPVTKTAKPCGATWNTLIQLKHHTGKTTTDKNTMKPSRVITMSFQF